MLTVKLRDVMSIGSFCGNDGCGRWGEMTGWAGVVGMYDVPLGT